MYVPKLLGLSGRTSSLQVLNTSNLNTKPNPKQEFNHPQTPTKYYWIILLSGHIIGIGLRVRPDGWINFARWKSNPPILPEVEQKAIRNAVKLWEIFVSSDEKVVVYNCYNRNERIHSTFNTPTGTIRDTINSIFTDTP